MQVTIDIPEPLYSRLESRASESNTSVESLMVEGASHMLSDALEAAKQRATRSLLSMNLNDFWLMTADELDAFEQQFDSAPEEAVRALGLRRLDDPSE